MRYAPFSLHRRKEFTQLLGLDLENTLKNIYNDNKNNEKEQYVLLTLHPVLYHQSTRSFINPYSAFFFKSLFDKYHIQLNQIISIHDDIYDIYKELLRGGKLFNPGINREKNRDPFRDILELNTLLNWRDRELSVSRSLAKAIETKHLLFHKKGRISSLWDIVIESKPCVYFSHPISQPRKDINHIADAIKSKIPDEERGKNLIRECQNFANSIAQFIPLIEPTAIDEYRINLDSLKNLNEIELKPTQILPPLTERWPIGTGERLCGQPDLDVKGLIEISSEEFKSLDYKDYALDSLYSAVKLLENEIKRQISVRDHCLAEQADLIVAFRPFSHPNSPDATGGVDKEINVIKSKIILNIKRCHPSIVIINPIDDEIRRRENQFRGFWNNNIVNDLEENTDSQKHDFYNDLLSFVVDIDLTKEKEKYKTKIRNSIEKYKLKITPTIDQSSMPKEAMARAEDANDIFINKIVDTKSLYKSEQESVELGENEIKWIGNNYDFIEIGENLREVIEKGVSV